jgi:cbb3-type cytochrome oxidase subunit 3
MIVSIGVWHGLWSLLILGLFIAIVAHVWSGRRRHYYEQAGHIPLRDGDDGHSRHPVD